MKQKITTWYRWNKKAKKFLYNHYEDGHIINNKPTPKFKSQKNSWNNVKWQKSFVYLENSKVLEHCGSVNGD